MPFKPPRPVGVTLLAVAFLWIGVCGTLAFPIFVVTGATQDLGRLLFATRIHSEAWLKVITVTFTVIWFLAYVAYAIIGFGLWKLKNWARKAILGITAFLVVASLLSALLFIRPAALGASAVGLTLVYGGWIAWYLLRPRVRYAFGAWIRYSPEGAWIEPPGLSKRSRIGVALLAPISFSVLFILPLLFAADWTMRRSEPYKLAMNSAQSSPCVTRALGSPLESTGLVTGSTEESSTEGTAELDIPLQGPKGPGKLELTAKKLSGTWQIDSLDFTRGTTRSSIVPPSPCQ